MIHSSTENFQPEPQPNSELKAENKQVSQSIVSGSRVLYLSLKKKPFDVMVTGEKNEEFRKRSNWIMSRLYDKKGKQKHYDYVKFVNGYGNDKPFFICKYEGVFECYMKVAKHSYSNGLVVEGIGKGDFIVLCGNIVELGNV